MKTFEITSKNSRPQRITIDGESFIIPSKGTTKTFQSESLPEAIKYLSSVNALSVKEILPVAIVTTEKVDLKATEVAHNNIVKK